MTVPDSNMIVPNPAGDAPVSDKELVAVRAAQQADAYGTGLPAYGSTKQGADLQQFHQMMRGRYRLAIILLVIGAVAGTIIGFKCGKKTYVSRGIIQVNPVIPKVLYTEDDKGMMPMFDNFVESQAAWMRSPPVVALATIQPGWQKVRPGNSDTAIEDFSKELTITHEGQLIFVQVVDEDATTAQTAVGSIIHAYGVKYQEKDDKNEKDRFQKLHDIVESSKSDYRDRQTRISQIADSYGTTDLQPLLEGKVEKINALEAEILEQKILQITSGATGAGGPSSRPAQGPLTVEELAQLYPALAKLQQQSDEIDDTIADLKGKHFGAQYSAVIAANEQKARIVAKMNDMVARLQAEQASGVHTTVSASGATINPALIQQRIDLLTAQRDKLEIERVDLGQKNLIIKKYQDEAKAFQEAQEAAQKRIDELNVERTINARIDVLSSGDLPTKYYRNTQIPFSAAGGFGGAFLGFGIVALLALMDQRLRSPGHGEIKRFNAPVLGMLPRLPEDIQDPVHAAMAAHCVHEIRTLLQISNRQSMHRVFGISSPNAGAGKTTLTLALGASYAASNLRTLIVDCDLVAGGLTRRLDVVIPRTFGDILIREGLVQEHQMAATAKIAGDDAEQQGEMLVSWNVITPAQKQRAFELTTEEPVGILDAIHGTPVLHCVQETGIRNLFVMPVGTATSRDVPLLSPEALHRLFNQLGREFDVVIVDSGPILGSLEASLVAGAVDGVVMTVSKGDRRNMLERAMAQLGTVGARVAGIVFNGASVDELVAYNNGSSSYSGASSDRFSTPAATSAVTVPVHYGPLTRAVATSAPAVRANSVNRAD